MTLRSRWLLALLVSYPDGFAAMAGLTRTMRVLATSGQDWAEGTGRPASHMPNPDIFHKL